MSHTSLNSTVGVVAAALVTVAVLGAVVAAPSFMPTPESEDEAAVHDPLPDLNVRAARAEAKNAVARDLIDGRLSLAEAAARFGWLNDLPPAAPVPQAIQFVLGQELCGYDSQELLLIQVVVWAEGCARRERADREEAIGRRLRAELSRALSARTELPAVSSDVGATLLARP